MVEVTEGGLMKIINWDRYQRVPSYPKHGDSGTIDTEAPDIGPEINPDTNFNTEVNAEFRPEVRAEVTAEVRAEVGVDAGEPTSTQTSAVKQSCFSAEADPLQHRRNGDSEFVENKNDIEEGISHTIRELGYVLDSGSPICCGTLAGLDDPGIGDRFDVYRLLDEAEEELAAAVGPATVESKSELVQVVVEMLTADGPLMGSDQPTL